MKRQQQMKEEARLKQEEERRKEKETLKKGLCKVATGIHGDPGILMAKTHTYMYVNISFLRKM